MNCLVTGGAGFIGSHIVDHLLAMEYGVSVIDDLSGGYREHINLKAAFYPIDICDTIAIDKLFEHSEFDYVFHCAAAAPDNLSHFTRLHNYKANVLGSVNLINAAIRARIKRFVFLSSMAVYGAQDPPFREDISPPQPDSPHGIAKVAVEADLKAARALFGLDFTIFRLHNVYGERVDLNNPYHNVVGIFMKQILEKKAVTIFGDGRQSRAFTYIDDVAPLIAHSVESASARNEIFNLGADRTTTVSLLAEMVAKSLNLKVWDIVHLPTRFEPKHAYCSHAKANRLLNRPQPLALGEGLANMAAWARTFDLTVQTRRSEIEINDKLPQKWARARR